MSGFEQARPTTKVSPCTQWSNVMPLWGAPQWLADARRALSRVANLPIGWDGGGAAAPGKSVIEAASRILEEIEAYSELPTPAIGPSLGGGVGIEWRNGVRDLDLEILPNGTIEYLRAESKANGFDVNEMDDGQIPTDNIKEIRKHVKWLMGY